MIFPLYPASKPGLRFFRKSIGQFIIFGLLIGTTGCAAQQYELASSSDPAFRSTLASKQGDDDPVRLMNLDDRPPPLYGDGWPIGYANHNGYVMHLTPGSHTVVFQCWFYPFALLLADSLPGQVGSHYLVSSSPGQLSFDTVAGHTYKLVGTQAKSRWKVSVEDNAPDGTQKSLAQFTEGDLVMRYIPPYRP